MYRDGKKTPASSFILTLLALRDVRIPSPETGLQTVILMIVVLDDTEDLLIVPLVQQTADLEVIVISEFKFLTQVTCSIEGQTNFGDFEQNMSCFSPPSLPLSVHKLNTASRHGLLIYQGMFNKLQQVGAGPARISV